MSESANQVIIYSTPTCPYCVFAKEYFRNMKVPFTDVDVSRDHNAAQEMIKKSGQMGVPVIDINGTILVGFQPEAFDELLKSNK